MGGGQGSSLSSEEGKGKEVVVSGQVRGSRGRLSLRLHEEEGRLTCGGWRLSAVVQFCLSIRILQPFVHSWMIHWIAALEPGVGKIQRQVPAE